MQMEWLWVKLWGKFHIISQFVHSLIQIMIQILHSSLPHTKIKHTDCSNCSGEPHHCTLLHLSKWMVNPTTARYSISASASESFQCHTSSTQKSRVKYLLLHAQVQCTLTFTHIQLVSLNKSCLQYTDTYIHIYQMYKIDNCVQCCTEEEWPDITPTGRHFTKTRIYW